MTTPNQSVLSPTPAEAAKASGSELRSSDGLGAPAPMCPPDCGHSAAEHEAFDAGVMTGEREGWEARNPYSEREQYDLWDAWETGASVGRMAHVEPEQGTYTTT